MGLKVDLRIGEAVRLDNGRITVTLLEKSGQRARLDIAADQSVRIEPPQRITGTAAARGGLTMSANSAA